MVSASVMFQSDQVYARGDESSVSGDKGVKILLSIKSQFFTVKLFKYRKLAYFVKTQENEKILMF